MRKTMIATLLLLSVTAFGQVALKGKKVYTMAGEVITDGVVLCRDGKIEKVGKGLKIPDGYKTYEAAVITPGLVDAHTVVGLAGYLNQDHDQDQLERSKPIQPDLRAIDAYNAREALVGWLREHGVTTIHTGHGPGALISGQTMIAKTIGETVDEAVVQPVTMLAVTLGQGALAHGSKSPGTRAKQIAMLRNAFLGAQAYLQKLEKAEEGKEPPRDLKKEMLAKALKGEVRLLVTANRVQDMMNALRLAEEFKLKLVLDSAAEAYLIADKIKASGFPVILHPTMKRSFGDSENLSMETAVKLKQAGIPFALQSGFESYVPKTRVVLFEAAIAARFGLAFEDALASITIDAARILGIDDRVGSLQAGKDADIVMFDGDPFEYTTHVTGVMINGALVSDKTR
ncbi:MAG: amidohydrolase family protein [Acidobacteriota bacterium]|nr:amidohydrolase family protein [Acidobacteriota bacterium]